MGQHSPKMGQHRCSGRIFATPVLGSRKVSEKKCFAGTVMRPRWPLGRAFLESILQHDPKTVQMDLMNDGSGVSWHLAGHYKIIVLDPSLPRHGRCWAKPIQSGHAVQRKRCGSLNLSFSYWEAALNRRPFFQPSRSVSWNLAGHWREPSRAHRGRARPRQDSAFSEKSCCKNGAGASQATGESFFKQNFGNKGEVMKTT